MSFLYIDCLIGSVMSGSDNKILSFDGLRAVAVVSVMLFHAGFPGFKLGSLGVDLFFALSGFLITHLFIKEYQRSKTINLKNFWIRRFLRLMPIYWLYLSIITILIATGVGELTEYGGWSPAEYIASMWLYFINYLPFGGIWTKQYLTIHLWTLAVEEQFYLIWPLVMVFLLRCGWLLKGLLIILVLFAFYYLFFASYSELLKKISGRGITLFLGCLFAVFCYQKQFHKIFKMLPANYMALLILLIFFGMTALIYLGSCQEKHIEARFSAYFGALFCCLIVCLYHQSQTYSHRILELPVLTYVGKISYGIYLYHILVQKVVWELIYPDDFFNSPVDYLLRLIIYFALTLVAASLSYHSIECYFLKFKDKFRT